MGWIGSKTETVRCSKCKNFVDAKVLSEYLGTPSIKGISVNKVIKLASHKNNGFFSSKCNRSGSEFTVAFWHPSDKVRKARCMHCKRSVAAYILNRYSRSSRLSRDVDKQTTTIVMKLLYHKRGSRKCRGTGRVTKERHIDWIDNNHP